MKAASQPSSDPRAPGIGLLAMLLVGLLIAAYVLVRYQGQWGEIDTSNFTTAIRAIADEQQLVPDQEEAIYANGYAFQSLSVFLLHMGGVSIVDIQTIYSALLAIWLIVPAWLLYREFTGSGRGATLASVLLFIQPEFLFALLRGTHEKFTRGLMLICLYLLVRSLGSTHQPGRLLAFVLSFYLCGYALITYNNLLATSFILAIGLALLLQFIVQRTAEARDTRSLISQRLMYATVILLVLAFIFTFYAYRPAEQNLLVMQSIWDRLAALILDVDRASNPYRVVNTLWRSTTVYILVSLANWLLLFSSALIWCWQAINWLRGKRPFWQRNELLLWAFYGAFAFQGAMSIAVDVSGALSSNLQHRVFPSFAMLGAPVTAAWLLRLQPKSRVNRLAFNGLLATMVSALAVLSIAKATNEPLLSNKWIMYQPGELQAIRWADGALSERTLWVGHDERLYTAYTIANEARPRSVRFDQYALEPGTIDYLISEINRQQGVRLEKPLPVEADSLRTYDNGEVQIYHRRPRTPFQK